MRKAIASKFGLQRGPIIKVYDGYGDQDNIILYGHVLRSGPKPVKRYRGNVLSNSFALFRLFMVRPLPKMTVQLHWNGEIHEAVTNQDGFYKVEWEPTEAIEPGWHVVTVTLKGNRTLKSVGRIFVPYPNQLAIISDIDDTFLISHSANLRKRLFVLLTKNAETRQPFEDVVDHYRALAIGTGDLAEPNPFFYVSSSEWNLYGYIKAFCAKHGLPEGILLLSPMKQLRNVWKTGQGKHSIKFVRIARIMSSYPQHRYVLLGDDTQQDPHIYASIVEHFPGKVHAIYLRRIRKSNEEKVRGLIEKMAAAGVHCCYFGHSREAIEHSLKIGLITREDQES